MGCWSVLKTWFCAVFLMCGVLFVCGGCGCGKTKAPPLQGVYTNRANDTVYLEQLQEMRQRQIEVAEVEVAIARRMTQHVEQVKATLPQDAGEDKLQEALAADAAWQELEAKAKAQADLAQKVWEEGRDFIRDRMIEQGQAEKDVQAGKAKSLDKPYGMDGGTQAQAEKDVQADKAKPADGQSRMRVMNKETRVKKE